MVQKRKATTEFRRQSKRLQASGPDDANSSDHASDSESVASYCLSDNSYGHRSQSKTPITPFSPTGSSKYPSDLKTHVCPYDNCDKAFNRPARLAEHIRSHTNERIFHCEYDGCNKSFLRASHLNHHVKSAHTMVRDYVCDKEGCGKTFVTGSRLRRHLAAHEGRDKYRCVEYPPCNETFRKHTTLQKHVMMVHLNQKPFPCPHIDPATGEKCQQGFDTAGHLRAHEGRIHGGARFTCTECSNSTGSTNNGDSPARVEATFHTYALLQAHLRSAHPPTCPECSLTCSSSRELRRHLEIAHGNVSLDERRTHPCSYPGCGRSFTKKGNLNVHIKTVHEGEKRFICGETDLSTSKKVDGWMSQDGCGKRYGSKLALEEHVRTAHLGLKNAKAARREQLGLTSQAKDKTLTLSKLAMLTGEGYAEESGRHIPCLIEQCQHLFRRDYDLWVHMGSKHRLEENDIQILFMRRAMHGGDHSFDLDLDALQLGFPAPQESGAATSQACREQQNLMIGEDFLMPDANGNEEDQSSPGMECSGQKMMAGYDGDDGLEAIDPLLTLTTTGQ
ncbi:Strongly-conserved Zn-finger binding protein (TFIIIA) [Coccidioides posadasii str. Silveira]|uniref:C2H2 transcription factor n=2 Tax=Coccidioides posadasii TaxID=199306 RepID=E9DE66_COCPS|nr:C2H2 transcription factor [Coccidioides posadasii str. Silveira]KMM70384.1 oocyte zinc finger protein XlCOF22 [Coccidioides posadasii RMSCC 3488]QVM13424.1 Strongly-conserved Zn-finger binding protein (TFIIIA) [Coccidioides posadasii str. Silveira]